MATPPSSLVGSLPLQTSEGGGEEEEEEEEKGRGRRERVRIKYIMKQHWLLSPIDC